MTAGVHTSKTTVQLWYTAAGLPICAGLAPLQKAKGKRFDWPRDHQPLRTACYTAFTILPDQAGLILQQYDGCCQSAAFIATNVLLCNLVRTDVLCNLVQTVAVHGNKLHQQQQAKAGQRPLQTLVHQLHEQMCSQSSMPAKHIFAPANEVTAHTKTASQQHTEGLLLLYSPTTAKAA